MRDYPKEQPERFARAVRALCGRGCPYPNCTCQTEQIAEAINAWEALPVPNGQVKDDRLYGEHTNLLGGMCL